MKIQEKGTKEINFWDEFICYFSLVFASIFFLRVIFEVGFLFHLISKDPSWLDYTSASWEMALALYILIKTCKRL